MPGDGTVSSRRIAFGTDLAATDHPFSPNTYSSIKAITPFMGDYIAVAATATTAYAVWTDNRVVNPTLNATEDADATTNPASLINGKITRRQRLLRQGHEVARAGEGRRAPALTLLPTPYRATSVAKAIKEALR